jgi:hypothetical protein
MVSGVGKIIGVPPPVGLRLGFLSILDPRLVSNYHIDTVTLVTNSPNLTCTTFGHFPKLFLELRDHRIAIITLNSCWVILRIHKYISSILIHF